MIQGDNYDKSCLLTDTGLFDKTKMGFENKLKNQKKSNRHSEMEHKGTKVDLSMEKMGKTVHVFYDQSH